MVARPTIGTLSVQDFAALEDANDAKHELVDGRVVAMGGGSPEHAARVRAPSSLGSSSTSTRCTPIRSRDWSAASGAQRF
jgi:hypothetical protein